MLACKAGLRLLAPATSASASASASVSRPVAHSLQLPLATLTGRSCLRVPSQPATRLSAAAQRRLAFSTTSSARDAPWPDRGSGPGAGYGSGAGAGNPPPEPTLLQKMSESAATTLASVLVLALGFAGAGYTYHKFYKHLVLKKIRNAFEPGDPVLELAAIGRGIPPPPDAEHWVTRDEQAHIDDVVAGKARGHYLLMMGEKGSGKSSMLLDAMRKSDGDGCSMFEAHADLEIFRLRLGKALDYEYHEDYIGGYFSERGPRESTALLDIERALNKLEKVAIKRRVETGKPLVLVVNQCHLLRDDADGKDLLELLQQRAEQWAAANVVTMIFNSDDYWVYERFKLLATRMEVLPITDLPKPKAIAALRSYRERYFQQVPEPGMLEEVYDRVGGRLSFLNRVARSKDMLETCDQIKDIEKTWLLNQCWILGEEMDDDVMDQQKWAVSSSQRSPTYISPTGSMLCNCTDQIPSLLLWLWHRP